MSSSNRAAAVVCRSASAVEVSAVDVGDPGPREVLVRRQLSGVSNGTDKWVMSGRFGWAELPPPLVPGYQAYGTIEALGAEVDSFTTGQSVFVTRCEHFADVSAAWGGHSALGVTPVEEVYDATDVPGRGAALCVTAQVGENAASRLRLEPGDPVVVVGDGIIGASAALAARRRGYAVTLVGRHADRLAAVGALGVTTLVDEPGLAQQLRGIAPAGVIDTVQNLAAFDAYVDAFAPDRIGQLVYSGHAPDSSTAWGDMARMQQRQLSVQFVSGWTRTRIESVLGFMRQGEMPVDQLVGAVVDTPDTITDLMIDIVAGRHRALASVIDWTRC